MEFGNVRWCEDPVDPGSSAADKTALEIAAEERAKIGGQSAELLRAARTNGELFLALPANGPQRNSINDSGIAVQRAVRRLEEPCHGPDGRRGGISHPERDRGAARSVCS